MPTLCTAGGGAGAGCSGDVPHISSGMASHDTRMSALFLAAFLEACSDMAALVASGAAATPGSTMTSSGSSARGGSGSGSGSGSRGTFHDDDISGDELERRTGCRDLPCNRIDPLTLSLCVFSK